MRASIITACLGAMLAWSGAVAAQAASYPSPEQLQIAKTGKYIGSDACSACHVDVHKTWVTSRHTMKATQGPAFGKDFEKNIYTWVRRDWDKLDTYMIVDTKDAKTNYLAARKVPMNEVTYVVGQTYKQRYMVYYDGGPLEVYEATTADGGISWKIDKSKASPYKGNKERAGQKILYIEVNPKDGQMNANNYGEWRSWQERCIGCHTTGFDHKAWDAAKADFVAGKRQDLKDIFVADLRVGCESCHGPGEAHAKAPSKGNIIHPAKITDIETRKMVCEQCHTRTQASTHSSLAQDLRGYRIGDAYMDFSTYTRPAWGKGNRQVSVDGKGRRDHQQDMDIRLSATMKGEHSTHAAMACFDCHDAHGVGNKNKKNPTLKAVSPVANCASCHGAMAAKVVKVMDGRQGWKRAGFPDWGTEYGRQGNKQHVFGIEPNGRSYGLYPTQYQWALKKGGDPKKQADWDAIWPWEKSRMEKQGRSVAVGAEPWK
jgi:cytochrome c553